jgi:F-type H+-transporting ATPase subunit b
MKLLILLPIEHLTREDHHMRVAGSGHYGPVVTGFVFFLLFCANAGVSLASGGESGGGGVTVIPDGSTIIQIVNFVVLIILLNLILYRPIRNIIKQRTDKIQGLELSIATSKDAAEEKDQAFAQGIKDARAKGMREKDSLMQEASEEEKRILDQINEKAQAELAEVRSKIAADAASVKGALSQQVDDFAKAISQKILGRNI